VSDQEFMQPQSRCRHLSQHSRYGEVMRVIGGRSRGRRLSAQLPQSVRPTSDRVREAIFDILGSMGGVQDLSVLDLFCGSGAMGLEALSRGAESVTFVDQDASACAAVKANLGAVGLSDLPATVVRAALPSWLHDAARVDLVLCDPPYAFGEWPALIEALPSELAVLESKDTLEVPESWMVTKTRRYGGTLVTVIHKSSAATTSVGS
jgi:16S rRNA (guanine966-N2)-methyltransferase